MVCPKCKSYQIVVIDSRAAARNRIRRRRKCTACGYRWSTYEMCRDDIKATEAAKKQVKRAIRIFKGDL